MKMPVKHRALPADGRADLKIALSLRFLLLTGLTLLLLAAMSAQTQAKDRSDVSGSMQSTGVDDNASGKAKFRIRKESSTLRLNLRKLDGEEEHSLKIGGVTVRDFTTNRRGKANIRVDDVSPDPRGHSMSVEDNSGQTVLVIDDFSGNADPSNVRQQEDNTLARTDDAPAGSEAKTRLRIKNGRKVFKVEVEDMPPGNIGDVLQVFIDGVQRGEITIGPRGEGEVKFDTNTPDEPNELPFPDDLNPQGFVSIQRNGTVLFSGSGAETAACTPMLRQQAFVRDPAVLVGEAKAELKTEEDCELSFEVEVEDAAPGTYELFVGLEADNVTPISRGTFVVGADGRGEIEFEVDDDDPDELPLNFDPVGQRLELQLGGVTQFTIASFDPEEVPIDGVNVCAFSETQIPLSNLDADADAAGDARFRVQEDCDENFRVRVRNLTPGTFDLFVDGVDRDDILVGVDGQGEIEFERPTPEPDEILLTFDVLGFEIQVKQADTVFLSGTIPGP